MSQDGRHKGSSCSMEWRRSLASASSTKASIKLCTTYGIIRLYRSKSSELTALTFTWPVIISSITMPKAHTSDVPSYPYFVRRAETISGARNPVAGKPSVNLSQPSWCWVAKWNDESAIGPSGVTRTFSGRMSRCTIPRALSVLRAVA